MNTPSTLAICLSWGPVHGAATEHMQMQMIDSLAAFRSRIHDNSKAFAEAFFRQFSCDQCEMTQQSLVGVGGLGERVDVLFGDNEKVRRRLGMDVGEGD